MMHCMTQIPEQRFIFQWKKQTFGWKPLFSCRSFNSLTINSEWNVCTLVSSFSKLFLHFTVSFTSLYRGNAIVRQTLSLCNHIYVFIILWTIVRVHRCATLTRKSNNKSNRFTEYSVWRTNSHCWNRSIDCKSFLNCCSDAINFKMIERRWWAKDREDGFTAALCRSLLTWSNKTCLH
jgi:hypothetical protein